MTAMLWRRQFLRVLVQPVGLSGLVSPTVASQGSLTSTHRRYHLHKFAWEGTKDPFDWIFTISWCCSLSYIAWIFHHRNQVSGEELNSVITVDIGVQEPYFSSLYIHVCLHPIPPLLPDWPRKASPLASSRTVLAKTHIWVRSVVPANLKTSLLTMYILLNKTKCSTFHQELVEIMIILKKEEDGRRRKRANTKHLSNGRHFF